MALVIFFGNGYTYPRFRFSGFNPQPSGGRYVLKSKDPISEKRWGFLLNEFFLKSPDD
jgi:hypothetical protein